jgi:hypothetical protein
MGDSDVQDVRDMVASRKAEDHALYNAIQRIKKIPEKPLDEEDMQMLLQLKDVVKTRRDQPIRLGVQPSGSLPSGSS